MGFTYYPVVNLINLRVRFIIMYIVCIQSVHLATQHRDHFYNTSVEVELTECIACIVVWHAVPYLLPTVVIAWGERVGLA